jgi:GNAT superfamily N-acetyltransferase
MSELRFRVRDARLSDQAFIVDANRRLAEETENKTLPIEVVERGVALALADPDRLRYWVVEDAETGALHGQTAITREWSDWRGGWLWWIQSVYVAPEARGMGVFRALHDHIRRLARAEGDVVGLRLYVEHANENARRTYARLGMKPGGYDVFEEIW